MTGARPEIRRTGKKMRSRRRNVNPLAVLISSISTETDYLPAEHFLVVSIAA
jgi:hypothetical protein